MSRPAIDARLYVKYLAQGASAQIVVGLGKVEYRWSVAGQLGGTNGTGECGGSCPQWIVT